MCGLEYSSNPENDHTHKCGLDHDPSKTIHQCEEMACASQWVSEEWTDPNG